ncbi:Aste57867_9720 [Aphanomyces stellatus]|uniref:Aste57867_9720 protein n=1 Tax=Aphanomyces stellatus TaxID=120398 RepID=A0A485KNV2_9STRA|nr:hypothetical protein As57867_009682 [Aphanomyces stellatus]VFT86599.1 Aste57867_9720 [Aphanomyces stellatus]
MAFCVFNGCDRVVATEAQKCAFHSHRSLCRIVDCTNQVYARGLCVRHGGKKQCQMDGCQLYCRVGKFCAGHGPSWAVRLCSEAGCTKQAHARGKCVRHGGGRQCKTRGCVAHARVGAFCGRHQRVPDHQAPRRTASSVGHLVKNAEIDDKTTGADIFELDAWTRRVVLEASTSPLASDSSDPNGICEWWDDEEAVKMAIQEIDFAACCMLSPPPSILEPPSSDGGHVLFLEL